MERISPGKLILFLFSFLSLNIQAKTVSVGKNGSYKSINAAISVANENDTIVVDGGIYREKTIVVNKKVALIGKNRPVIDGEKKYELVSVFASNVLISGFELNNGGISSVNDLAGIKIYRQKNVIIKNNILNNMFFGIYFQECNHCFAENNVINSSARNEVQSGNGIHCWKSDDMNISGNKITGQRDGIYFEFVTNSLITGNTSEGNLRYGLHFMFSHHNTYNHNIFRHNGAGVAVMYTHHMVMTNNTFDRNWGGSAYGLLMKDISDSEIRHNVFSSNTSGIYLEGSSRNHIHKNNFLLNGSAIRIQASCDDNIVEYNNFISNTFDVNTNGTMVQNIFRSNYWDKYEGYDLNRDKTGDVPYHPVSMYAMIIERMPVASILLRSFMVTLLDRSEKAIPSLTPENFRDNTPHTIPYSDNDKQVK